jgi:hypothetical protein
MLLSQKKVLPHGRVGAVLFQLLAGGLSGIIGSFVIADVVAPHPDDLAL